VLQGRGVTLYAHTSDNVLRLDQQPIHCRQREAAFSLDGLVEHDTELDPKVCYTDTHGYTEVVMATATLLGYELAPRIRHQGPDLIQATIESLESTSTNCPEYICPNLHNLDCPSGICWHNLEVRRQRVEGLGQASRIWIKMKLPRVGEKHWEKVHLCPGCGFVINLAEIDLRAITTGILLCSRCEWSGTAGH
jgi:hypothetical protein